MRKVLIQIQTPRKQAIEIVKAFAQESTGWEFDEAMSMAASKKSPGCIIFRRLAVNNEPQIHFSAVPFGKGRYRQCRINRVWPGGMEDTYYSSDKFIAEFREYLWAEGKKARICLRI